MEKKLPRIERGTTKIIVPHENKETAFDGRSEGSGDYQTVGGGLLARNLKVPIGDYTASLVHATYCLPEVKNEPEVKKIKGIMRNSRLWVFNRNLWIPEGVYVVPDLTVMGRSQPLNQNELEKMLKGGKELSWGGIRLSKDGRVRFAPKETYKLGGHTPESLAKDGFVIANYSPIGAEKLGEVASKFRYNPRTFGIDIQKGQNPELTVFALGEALGWLDVEGHIRDIDKEGRAFGVLE